MTQPDTSTTRLEAVPRLKAYYEKNEHSIAVIFFVAGFVFDIVTLERIDSSFAIGQQALYLVLIATALTQMFLEQTGPAPLPDNMFVLKRWYYQSRTGIVHFLFGSLLSLYTLFFFKSSSLLASFGFLVFLVLLLVANESSYFKSLGLQVKFAMLSLCVLSFFSYVVPIAAGSISVAIFLTSMALGSLPVVCIGGWIHIRRPALSRPATSQIHTPLGIVLLAFLVLYFFRVIPPVPLSIPFIGVYHAVERTEQEFRLSHERPAWRFWHNGDQAFVAQPGDKIYVFFRVFSPTRFSGAVVMRWYRKDEVRGWTLQDSIPIKIVGGREQGFRGFGFKSKYQPGAWKVQIETTDSREIGRVYFDLELGPESPRSFRIDIE
jgi:Protein of unknown function (DUF2914)